MLIYLGIALGATLFAVATRGYAIEGPSLDCSRGVKSTLAIILCTKAEAAQADWDLNSAYWAFYNDDREADAFNKTVSRRCALPPLLPQHHPITQGQVSCVARAFRSQAAAIRARLKGDALAESNLTPQQHLDIQASLSKRGLLRNRVGKYGANLDGQFGPNTRAAITDFQRSIGAQPTGFLSKDQRQALLESSAPSLPPIFSVDGLALHTRLEESLYRQYHCVPSEQFPGFIWCRRKRAESEPRGQYTSHHSILRSADGTAFYINRTLEPAFFTGKEANEDISQLTKKYHAAPRIIPMPPNSAVPHGMIAVWGGVVLEPLGDNSIKNIAAGRQVYEGIMIDHIADYPRSARLGLPIYRLGGGPGYVWAASWNDNGRGTLRFLAIDPSAFTPLAVSNEPAPPKSLELPTVAKPTTLGSVTKIPMKKEGGTYTVPVLINNALTLDFVVDSGASDVAIPADVVSTLVRTRTFDKSDFIGTQTYMLADGSTLPSIRFRIRSLKVGGKTLNNVIASLAPSQGSLLLGQSFLSRFRSWSIDNTEHVLLLDEGLTGKSQAPVWQESPQGLRPSAAKRIKDNVSLGYMNLRAGPGQDQAVLARIPAGADVLLRGPCVPATDSKSEYPFCYIQWKGQDGWISSSGLE